MNALSSESRTRLEKACVRGRRATERACRAAIGSLELLAERAPVHLSKDARDLRRGLQAKRRQLGDEGDRLDLLVADCAYEQWHRLLFARFLAENSLLIHPEFRAPVTLAECEELAGDLGEPDGWAVAGRFAAEILPGIFQLDDPCVRLRLAPEGRLELEQVVASLPVEAFLADDALGWVYQHWQNEKKGEVNASERKIGGADVGPVTQLFTENYLVRFLLENSLGAWWASRHPDSPLLKTWEYLRFDDGRNPAAGSFDGWPTSVAEVTVMDPCCGSGHFLIEAFEMLWRMRAEEEGLAPIAAQDAVLRNNLFGLELDPRCVQIGMFAVALAAWKAGDGWRELPLPNIACSGTPVKASANEWTALAGGDERLGRALARLHLLFRDADTLGSLIHPKRAVEVPNPTGSQKSFDDVEWDRVPPLLRKAVASEAADPATAVLGADVAGVALAADFLSRRYTLAATNVPYLSRGKQAVTLADYCASLFPAGSADLAVAFLLRLSTLVAPHGTYAAIFPAKTLNLNAYRRYRDWTLTNQSWSTCAVLGTRAFSTPMFDLATVMAIISDELPCGQTSMAGIDVSTSTGPVEKAATLRSGEISRVVQSSHVANPDNRILLRPLGAGSLLSDFADSTQGICTGDYPRFGRFFWELPVITGPWVRQQSTVPTTQAWGGREHILYWQSGDGALREEVSRRLGPGREGAWLRGLDFIGRDGVVISQTGRLSATGFSGELLDNNAAAISPRSKADLPALWAFLSSDEYHQSVREIDTALKVTNKTLLKVPFDLERWRAAADAAGPLSEPWSDDPTQWLFQGRPETAMEPLQVAVGRLLGYSWPEQPASDDSDEVADVDGIACLPSVLGERTTAARIQELLARAFGGTWSPARAAALLADSGSKKKDVESWLRDEFFKAHCQVFKNRPFIWHVWDGRRDGFSALVNYHRLNRPTLERLAYTYLGDWIERQVAGAREDVVGSEERLAAAHDLQRRLELILTGEPPYDIYVRWKAMAEQPIGWDPDLNDGVRLNIRPFVEAKVLRSKLNVKWDRDRGKSPDGPERLNNLHFTTAQKQAARAGVPS